MKTRHATFIAGTLNAAYSGHVHEIVIAGLATPPDASGAYNYPIFFHATGSAYAHGGLQLTNAAGQRDNVAYTSWTEAAGVYTFAVDATLAYSYALGDAAGPLNSACLRRADGAKPILPYHQLQGYTLYGGLGTFKSLRIQDYVDGFFGAVCGECENRSGWGWPLWLNNFRWTYTVEYYHSNPKHYDGSTGMCGNMYIFGSALYHYRWQHSTEIRWHLGISCFGSGATYKNLWNGYKACEGGDPRGTYTRASGCGAPTALVIEEVP